jgi:hypothetical protein
MKPPSRRLPTKRNLIFALLTLFIFFGCKKEDLSPLQPNDNKVTSSAKSALVASDGIITVQASIFPPATQQSFVANGAFSLAEFQVVSSQHVFLYSGAFNATSPLIAGLVAGNFYFNDNGVCPVNSLGGDVYPDQGVILPIEVVYNAVDNTTSGSVGKLSIKNLEYRTDDEVYHMFYPNKSVEAPDICVVNNIAHIQFTDPANKKLANGYIEIADVKLSGDTGWTLSALPVSLSSFNSAISDSKLIVRSGGQDVPTTSAPIYLGAGFTAQTVVNFTGGFHHTAGKTETLKIFAQATGPKGIITRLFPLTSFKWKDGLDVLIPGAKNSNFFKEDTGQSVFHP